MVAAEPTFSVVPPCFAGETVVILGSGPSLTAEDVASCRRACVIAIKDAYRMAPWADVLYSADERWWNHHGKSIDFAGMRYALVSPEPRFLRGVEEARAQLLRLVVKDGLSRDPGVLHTGYMSGFSAINLAVHFGAKKIVLLGYDMQPSDGRDNFFGEKPYAKKPPPYQWLGVFDSLVAPLADLGIEIVNATRSTALKAFPCVSLEDALC